MKNLQKITREAEKEDSYFCNICGYSPTNRSMWCDMGCGRDYNEMIQVKTRLITSLIFRTAHLVAESALRAVPLDSDIHEDRDKCCVGCCDYGKHENERGFNSAHIVLKEAMGEYLKEDV